MLWIVVMHYIIFLMLKLHIIFNVNYLEKLLLQQVCYYVTTCYIKQSKQNADCNIVSSHKTVQPVMYNELLQMSKRDNIIIIISVKISCLGTVYNIHCINKCLIKFYLWKLVVRISEYPCRIFLLL